MICSVFCGDHVDYEVETAERTVTAVEADPIVNAIHQELSHVEVSFNANRAWLPPCAASQPRRDSDRRVSPYPLYPGKMVELIMNDSRPDGPHPSDRRALPTDENSQHSMDPRHARRRGRSAAGPRRAEQRAPGEVDEPGRINPWRHGWWWVVAVAGVALLGLVLSLVLRPSVVTSTPQRAVPVSTPSETSSSSESSTVPPQTVLPDSSASPTLSVSPQDTAPPLPGTAPPSPSIFDQSPVAEPEPTATIKAGDIQLNDARFSAPQGWTLSGDEQIENARRAVRLSQQDTDIRLQAVTLDPSGQELGSSCGSLVDIQQEQFTEVKRHLMVPVGVDAGLGSAVRCGFTGIRTSDGAANTVTFTLVSRTVDSHVLMLRTTVPEQSADESPVIAQLSAMTCATSTSFGVTLPLCG